MGRIAVTVDNTIMKRPKNLSRKTCSLTMEEFLGLVNKTYVQVNIYNENNEFQRSLSRLDVLKRSTIEPRMNFSTYKPYAIYVVDFSEVPSART